MQPEQQKKTDLSRSEKLQRKLGIGNLSIRTKILGANIGMFIIVLGVFTYIMFSMHHISTLMQKQQQATTQQHNANHAMILLQGIRFWLSDLSLSQLTESEKKVEAIKPKLLLAITKLKLNKVENKRLLDNIEKIYNLGIEAADAYADENRVLGNSLTANANKISESLYHSLQQIGYKSKLEADRIAAINNKSLQHAINMSMILLGIAVTIFLLVSWGLAKLITKPIREAITLAETVASGNLQCDIVATTTDETGQLLQALEEMKNNITTVIKNIVELSEVLQNDAAEIARGNLDLSNRTEEQASALNKIAASIKEISVTIGDNAEQSRNAEKTSVSAQKNAQTGSEIIEEVATAVNHINKSSTKVGDIISTIDEIAFQTNLLALNAAVEAARAGEEGQGFAVVAAEVRQLAQRSASAAQEVKELIQTNITNVHKGDKLVLDSKDSLNGIATEINHVGEMIANIANASTEQANAVTDITDSVNSIDNTTQQNAALVEEVSAVAQSVQQQASNLTTAVQFFKV